MQASDFSLFLRGTDILDHQALERLFEAGCDDATFGAADGAQYANFHREEASFARAVMTAIDCVEHAVDGVMVVGISALNQLGDTEHAEFIAALNGALAVRHRAGQLREPDERQAVAQLIDQTTPLLEGDAPVSA